MDVEAVLARLRACGFRYLCDEPASLPEDGVCAFADARRKMMQSAGVVPVKVRAAAQSGFDALIRLIEYSARLEAGLLVVPLRHYSNIRKNKRGIFRYYRKIPRVS